MIIKFDIKKIKTQTTDYKLIMNNQTTLIDKYCYTCDSLKPFKDEKHKCSFCCEEVCFDCRSLLGEVNEFGLRQNQQKYHRWQGKLNEFDWNLWYSTHKNHSIICGNCKMSINEVIGICHNTYICFIALHPEIFDSKTVLDAPYFIKHYYNNCYTFPKIGHLLVKHGEI